MQALKFDTAIITFAIGTVISVIAFATTLSWEQSRTENLFNFGAQIRLASFRNNIVAHTDMVNDMAELLTNTTDIDSDTFSGIISDELDRTPDLVWIAWSPQTAQPQHTLPGNVSPKDSPGGLERGSSEASFPALYIEPHQDDNNNSLQGFDIASDSASRLAIEKARDSGEAILTGRLRLSDGSDEHFGYQIIRSVYHGKREPESVEERRRHFAGVIVGEFRFSAGVQFTMADIPPIGIDVWVIDSTNPEGEKQLHFHASRTRSEPFKPTIDDLAHLKSGLHMKSVVKVLDREWTFLFGPAPAFIERHRMWGAWTVLGACILITLLASLYLHTMARNQQRTRESHDTLLGQIREREQAEIAQQKSEKRYRFFLESSPDWIWEVNAMGVYTYASPKVYDLIGYHADEIIGKTPFDLMPEKEAQRVGAIFQEIVATKAPIVNLENTNLHKNGTEVVLETSGTPILDENGELLGYHGIDRDVSQRSRDALALRVQRDFNNTLLDVAANVIVVLDLNGDIVRFNRAAEELTGYDSDEVIGRSVWDVVIPPEQKDQVMMIFESLRKGSFEVPSLYENEWMTRNGGRRLLRWSNSVLHNEQNDISHIIALGYDITEQRKAEDEHQRTQMELQQAQKMESLGHLTGGIAHDFNNLLGIINGYSELAQLKSAATEDVKLAEYINHIRDAGNRAAKLVAQMLAFSRRDATEKTPTNMGSLLSEDINLLRATLPSTITIESYIEEKLPPVSINTTQFNQMLMNLAVNARDAMDGKGRLTIGLRLLHNLDTSSSISHKPVKGEWIELSVSDSGCGIHSNIVPNIFNPFFTTKEVGKGTGMGLSVIYRIMENLGGHIMLDTELGKGSNFRLLFPPVTALNQNIATTTDNTAQYSGEGQEILIIDDEEALAIYLSERLRDAGYRPTHTASAMEAMEMFMQQPERFSVVITDQTMPGMTGSELIGRFREIHPELPAIICSGYSEKINAESAKELAIAYFEKPVEINRLLKKIYEVLH